MKAQSPAWFILSIQRMICTRPQFLSLPYCVPPSPFYYPLVEYAARLRAGSRLADPAAVAGKLFALLERAVKGAHESPAQEAPARLDLVFRGWSSYSSRGRSLEDVETRCDDVSTANRLRRRSCGSSPEHVGRKMLLFSRLKMFAAQTKSRDALAALQGAASTNKIRSSPISLYSLLIIEQWGFGIRYISEEGSGQS